MQHQKTIYMKILLEQEFLVFTAYYLSATFMFFRKDFTQNFFYFPLNIKIKSVFINKFELLHKCKKIKQTIHPI